MQAEMLDSTISQNHQELSSVEYVDSHENPIATIPRDDASVQDVEDPRSLQLIFGQRHHDIDCALCPTAKRACNRAWFSAKQVENWSGMTNRTLYNRLSELEEYQRISRLQDFANVNIPTETGAVKTTLYNLNVLNQLAMVEMKNKVLNETAKEFSDILSEVETTGSYGVTQTQNQPVMLPDFCNPAEAARAWADLYEKNQAAEKRAITAEADLASEKEAHEKDNVDFRTGLDIINAQKAQIGSNREATAMATASVKSRECKRLTAENAELKDAVGRGTNWHIVNMMTAEWERDFGHAPSWQKLKEFSADLPKDMQPVKDVEVKVVLKNGSEKISKVFRYHREAWAKYREYEENSRDKDKNVPDTKVLDLKATDTEIEVF